MEHVVWQPIFNQPLQTNPIPKPMELHMESIFNKLLTLLLPREKGKKMSLRWQREELS